MHTTMTLPDDMPVTTELIGRLPTVESLSVRSSDLHMPADLFDPATPVGSASPLDGHIPLVAARIDGSLEIVDGCKRLLRLMGDRGPDQDANVPVLILASPARRTAALLRMALNRGRPQHLREKICCAHWLFANLEQTTALRVSQEVGIPGGETRHLQSLAGAPEDVIAAVSSGRIDLALADDFGLLGCGDRAGFLRTFDGLALSHQTQRELLTWLPEIAHQAGSTVAEILKDHGTTDHAQSAPPRIKSIRDALHARRFPEYSATMARWSALAARVNPDPKTVRFAPSAAFERDAVDVAVSLRNPAQAARLFGELARVDEESWSALISPIDASAAQKPFLGTSKCGDPLTVEGSSR